MTAQINDVFRFNGVDYSVAGISEGELFDPSLLELKPAGTCTACWRGYRAVFSILNRRLVLAILHVNLLSDDGAWVDIVGPQINGISPTGSKGEYDWFNNHYEGLNYHLEYTGGLLLAHGFIEDLYVHMGFHPAWKYQTVVELAFDKGLLVDEFDRSNRMAEIRQMIIESRTEQDAGKMPTKDEIREFVERAFDRKYRI